MTRKTASLTYPSSPLNALRELQALNARPALEPVPPTADRGPSEGPRSAQTSDHGPPEGPWSKKGAFPPTTSSTPAGSAATHATGCAVGSGPGESRKKKLDQELVPPTGDHGSPEAPRSALSSDHGPLEGPWSKKETPPTTPASTPAEGSAAAHATGSAVGSGPGEGRKKLDQARPDDPASGDTAGKGEPMAEALWEMLARPYTADPMKGPFKVSTVKIPVELWERLHWLAAVTQQPQQAIIAEALKAHFRQVLKGK